MSELRSTELVSQLQSAGQLGGDMRLYARAAERISALERQNDQLGDMNTELREVLDEQKKDAEHLRNILTTIIGAYDRYRGKGVAPAPNEYQRMVGAINDARPEVATSLTALKETP